MFPSRFSDLEFFIDRAEVIKLALAIKNRGKRGLIPATGPGSRRTLAPTVTESEPQQLPCWLED